MAKTVGKKRRLTWWVIAVVFAVAGIGYLLFRHIEMRLQKAEFKRAEAYVEQVATELKGLARIGPNFANHTYNCRYASRKFAKGPRSCEVGYEMIFKNQSLDSSNGLLKKLSGYAKSQLSGSAGKNSFTDKPVAQNLEQTLVSENLSGMTCGILYRYGVADDSLGAPTQYRAKDFVASVSCYGGALAEYYPVSS